MVGAFIPEVYVCVTMRSKEHKNELAVPPDCMAKKELHFVPAVMHGPVRRLIGFVMGGVLIC
jgi:hypothetical protein